MRSVSGVMTRRGPLPRYSYPYGKEASQILILASLMLSSQYVRSCASHWNAVLAVAPASITF